MPTRIGRHGMALIPDPEKRWRVDLAKARWREADEPLLDGCPCTVCAQGYSRAYLHYLLRAKEQTVMRLLTIHNLAFLQRLMGELRDAVDEGRLAAVAAAVGAGRRRGSWPPRARERRRGLQGASSPTGGAPARARTTR